jgi:hypothetical protein
MTSYLYDDGNGLKTSAREELSLGKPITDVSNMVKTKSGLWVPQTGTEDGAANVQVAGSDVMIPTQLQGKVFKTVLAFTSAPIAANTYVTGANYIDCDGYDKVSVSVNMTSGTGMHFTIDWSHDGVAYFANPSGLIYDGSSQAAAVEAPVLARYARIGIKNKDATNPKTTVGYFLLKL